MPPAGGHRVAAKAAEAAAPEAAEASTTAARRIATGRRTPTRLARGRSPDWLKMKNADAPAVKREEEEEWGKTKRW
jgi:hypothetical protein